MGIDGCPGGWVAAAQAEVSGPSGAVRAVLAPRLESLLAEFDGVAVSLPASPPLDAHGLPMRIVF